MADFGSKGKGKLEAPSTSSASQNQESVFSKLLILLNMIPDPNCLNSSRSPDSTIVAEAVDAPLACLNCDGCRSAKRLYEMRRQVLYIQSTLGNMSSVEQDLGRRMETISGLDRSNLLGDARFQELICAVEKFKFQLPYTSLFELPTQQQDTGYTPLESPPDISTPMKGMYDDLTPKEKKCLWCCSVFDGEVKKRVLINWWIGEGLLGDSRLEQEGEGILKSLEQEGEDILKSLKVKGFIVWLPKRKQPESNTPDRWMMEPSVRFFIRTKAKEVGNFFDFNGDMLAGGLEAILLKSNNEIGTIDTKPVNRVKTVFNVNKSTVASIEAKIMAYMENIQVLHLGRSQPEQHVHVKGLKLILERLNKMKQLRLLSLHGISSLGELPHSVCNLTGLLVLDLRACQALRSLPSGIGKLKKLRHLDMSGCHILLHMPSGIRSLSSLEVLKGFVIGNEGPQQKWTTCTLHDLRELKNLHKLSIFVVRNNFPNRQDLVDLVNIKGLLKLKVLWKPARKQGQESADTGQNEPEQVNDDHGLNSPARSVNFRPPSRTPFTCCFKIQEEVETGTNVFQRLEKLDLWCTPDDAAPALLVPDNFPSLKQLYIRGAEFRRNLNNSQWCNVAMLRLLFLPNFEIKWDQLHGLFPQLSYLEMQNCPKLDEFSQYCDQDGVWEHQ